MRLRRTNLLNCSFQSRDSLVELQSRKGKYLGAPLAVGDAELAGIGGDQHRDLVLKFRLRAGKTNTLIVQS